MPSGHILIAGEPVAVAAHVVTFADVGGFDGRLRRCFFAPERTLPSSPAAGCNTAARFRSRPVDGLPEDVAETLPEGRWTRAALRHQVTQVIFHYDACATSSRCFEVLHDVRGLSCHFLLDVDGTLYQTLDLTARARHAGAANDVSIGVEIAHIGAYPPGEGPLDDFYRETSEGLALRLPSSLRPPPGRHLSARPSRIAGTVNGRMVEMPDYTDAQYRALAALVDALSAEFPALRRVTPRDAAGEPLQNILPESQRRSFQGFLGHHHVSEQKTDPGPAFDWDRVLQAGPSERP